MAINKILPSANDTYWLMKASKKLLPHTEKIANIWFDNYISSSLPKTVHIQIIKRLLFNETNVFFTMLSRGKIDDYLIHLNNLSSILEERSIAYEDINVLIHFFEEASLGVLNEVFHKEEIYNITLSYAHLLHNVIQKLNSIYFHELENDRNKLNALLKISEVSLGNLEIDELLQNLLEIIVDFTKAKAGIIWLIDERTQYLIPRANKNINERYMLHFKMPVGKYLAGTIAQKGKPLTLKDFPIPPKAQFYIKERKIKSMLGVPLKVKDKIIGVARLDYIEQRKFSEKNIKLFQTLADEASLTFENARLNNQHEIISTTLQDNIRPQAPTNNQTNIGIAYRSATKMASVGGDLFDFIKKDNNLLFLLGDVSGKGIAEAIDASMVKYTSRLLLSQESSLEKGMFSLNNFIYQEEVDEKFVTAICAKLDFNKNVLTLINAGHHNPLILQSITKKVSFLESVNDTALGIQENSQYNLQKIDFNKKDRIILYTDGLVEARKKSEQFGHRRLLNLAKKYFNLSPQELTDKIADEAKQFTNNTLDDDMAIITIEM